MNINFASSQASTTITFQFSVLNISLSREFIPQTSSSSLPLSPSFSINVTLLGFNPRTAFNSVSDWVQLPAKMIKVLILEILFYCYLYVTVTTLKWTPLHLSICEKRFFFSLWKCRNTTVGLEKQTEIIVCDCVVLLVWTGVKAFPATEQ